MTGLRRQAPILGVVLAWMFALGALLGGLSLARTLPQAHAGALAAAALCLPDEGGAPFDHEPHRHGDCALCPGFASASPLAALASVETPAAPDRAWNAAGFDPRRETGAPAAPPPAWRARGPPLA